jgi:hypothetical protein
MSKYNAGTYVRREAARILRTTVLYSTVPAKLSNRFNRFAAVAMAYSRTNPALAQEFLTELRDTLRTLQELEAVQIVPENVTAEADLWNGA